MKCTKPESEAAREAVRVLGGPTKTARLLGVPKARHQTVQSWMRSRVPAEYCPDVEAETRALGSVVWCERLRPDVPWGRIRGVEPPPIPGQLDDEQSGKAVHAASLNAGAADRVSNQTAGELV